jgi:hypothetical protein
MTSASYLGTSLWAMLLIGREISLGKTTCIIAMWICFLFKHSTLYSNPQQMVITQFIYL